MLVGGMKHKEQRFNRAAAGVSSVLLIISIIGAFTPTVFYQAYGSWEVSCDCDFNATSNATMCHHCTWQQTDYDHDPTYRNGAVPLMYIVAGILPIAYVIGLLFTLKTHSHIIYEASDDSAASHDAPEWSKTKCTVILLASTVMFGLIAEELVRTLEPTLDLIGIPQSFAGLTVIALIPNTAEFVNAIQFALQNNIALAFEIAGSAAVQVSLIQMPALIAFSAAIDHGLSEGAFTLIFPMLDVFAVIFSVIILNYISIDGKSDYFQGTSLIIIYALLLASFWFVPS